MIDGGVTSKENLSFKEGSQSQSQSQRDLHNGFSVALLHKSWAGQKRKDRMKIQQCMY